MDAGDGKGFQESEAGRCRWPSDGPGDALAQATIGVETDAAALTAVPADHIGPGMREQFGGPHHAVPVVVVLVRHRSIRQPRCARNGPIRQGSHPGSLSSCSTTMLPDGVIVPMVLRCRTVPATWIADRQAMGTFRHRRAPVCCGPSPGWRRPTRQWTGSRIY